jgi:hypothetical protein
MMHSSAHTPTFMHDVEIVDWHLHLSYIMTGIRGDTRLDGSLQANATILLNNVRVAENVNDLIGFGLD